MKFPTATAVNSYGTFFMSLSIINQNHSIYNLGSKNTFHRHKLGTSTLSTDIMADKYKPVDPHEAGRAGGSQ
jgi:hypothetical protein